MRPSCSTALETSACSAPATSRRSIGRAAAVERFAKRNDAGNLLSWTPQHAWLSDDVTAGWTGGVRTFLGPPDSWCSAKTD
jgi:hypothetical protein